MRYDTILFDVDNTLLDFDANEAESFRNMIRDKGEEYSDELYNTYKTMNEKLWQAIERGEMTVEEVVNTRFTRLMARYGKKVDGSDWECTYRKYLNRGIQEIPGVHQVLTKLRKSYRLFVITNGLEETQRFRMERSGLRQYFEQTFISECIGVGKPSGEFFDYVKSHITGFCAERTLVVGDSLTSDIKGGIKAGIDTCWFCRENTVNVSDIKPLYIIHQLEDIFTILE